LNPFDIGHQRDWPRRNALVIQSRH
jgi:hypothetical protein